MNIDVALVPAQARLWPPSVCVVIDQLRASSTIVSALDLGCADLWLSATLRDARRLARERDSLLAGEREGMRPAGFHANNSPTDLAALELHGRGLVLCTTNGTVVITSLASMPLVLVGCLANAEAVAGAAIRHALVRGSQVGIVCAGRHGAFALDDAYAAGVVADRMLAVAAASGLPCQLSDSARAVRHIQSSYPDPLAAFMESSTAELMLRIGAGDDLGACSRIDVSTTVPVVHTGPPVRVDPLPADPLREPQRS